MNLTPRQLDVIVAIRNYRHLHGYSPTMQELADQLGTSKVTIFEHVGALEKKRVLRRDKHKARSLEITADGRLPDEDRATKLPLLGAIAAGSPIEAVENREELDLEQMFHSRSGVYVLKVRGDSMIDDHLCDGDYVVIKKQKTAQSGQIVQDRAQRREAPVLPEALEPAATLEQEAPRGAAQARSDKRGGLMSHAEMLAEVDLADVGVGDDLRGGPFGEHSAVADDVGPVADAERLAHVMVGNQDADAALLQEADDSLDLDHGDRIDAGERLVEQDEARLGRQRAGDFDPAPLAARQRRRRRGAQLFDRQVAQQLVEHVVDHRFLQRPAGTVGLVVEHPGCFTADHHLCWYCRGCGGTVHDAVFKPADIGQQIKAMLTEFNANESLRKCKACGAIHPGKKPPAGWVKI
jgi:repressor LexA